MAPAISKKPLLSDLVAQIGKVPPSHIRPVGGRPDLANVDNESGAGIPLIDLKMLNSTGPELRKVVDAIGRACESDGFFMVTNHGIPAAVMEGMLRVARESFHLPESERVKCYSDDPNKAAEAKALLAVRRLVAILESLGLDLERSHMELCPQPAVLTTYGYGLPGHKDPSAITLLLQDGGLQVVQRGGRRVALNPAPNALAVNLGDLLQTAIRMSSTSFNMRRDCYPVESSFVDQWPSNQPSSFRAACNVSWGNIYHAIQRCVHKLGCSSPSYCLPITVNDPSPHGSETKSRPFLPLFKEKNDVNVEDVSKSDLTTIAGTLSLLVPTAINIDALTTNWGPKWKVFCGIFMIMSIVSAFIGLFTTSFRAGSRTRNLSSHCARMSFVVANIVFVLLIASKL